MREQRSRIALRSIPATGTAMRAFRRFQAEHTVA